MLRSRPRTWTRARLPSPLFEIALVLVRLDHIASRIVKHGQLLVAPRNETENVMEEKLSDALSPTLEVALICLDLQLLGYLALKVAEAIGV